MRAIRLSTLVLLTLVAGSAPCAGADLRVLGGDIALTVWTARAGLEPDAASNDVCRLRYSKEIADAAQKIVVATSLAAPVFLLSVEAVSVQDGSPTGEVFLSTVPQDLLIDITSTKSKTCYVLYQASSAAASGPGIECHTVTYTIVEQ